MRILLATDSYKPNIDGAAVFAETIATTLASRGVEVQVVAPSPSARSYDTLEAGVRVRYRAAWQPTQSRGFYFALNPAVRRAADSWRPSVIHVNLPWRIGYDALVAAKRLQIPLVATNHVVAEGASWPLSLVPPIGNRYEDAVRGYLLWFYRQCQVVTVPTPAAGAMLVGGRRRGINLKVVSNGVDLDLFRPRAPAGDERERHGLPQKPLVLYAGRLESEKSMDVWLRAAAEVRREMDVHFVIAGDGTMKPSLMTLARTLHLAEHTSFLGVLPRERLALLHSLATVFVITSATESQSIATLEAIASALPVVGVDACALPDLIREGKNGYLVPSGDDRAVAQRVLRLLRDSELRRDFSAESRAIAEAHSLERTVDTYLSLYRALAQGDRRQVA